MIESDNFPFVFFLFKYVTFICRYYNKRVKCLFKYVEKGLQFPWEELIFSDDCIILFILKRLITLKVSLVVSMWELSNIL